MYKPVWWFISALIFQSFVERYWPSLLALQAMGERLDMVGFWALSESVFYACHPASCSWTFAKPTVFPSHCANLSKNIAPWQPEPQAAFMGEEGDSYPEPLGPSICLALQPRHLLTAIVRLCQMTGQDPHGEPWSTLMHSYVCMHAHKHTHTGVHVFTVAFKGHIEAKCWLRSLSLCRWPALEAEVARKHTGSPCAIPADLPDWPPATVTALFLG